MPLHVYNIIIPGGLGLGEEKKFPYLLGEKKPSIIRSAGITSGFENSWSVCHQDTVQAEKRKKQKKK